MRQNDVLLFSLDWLRITTKYACWEIPLPQCFENTVLERRNSARPSEISPFLDFKLMVAVTCLVLYAQNHLGVVGFVCSSFIQSSFLVSKLIVN